MQEEIWKPVVGFEGLYEVSNLGRVRGLNRIVYDRNLRALLIKGKIIGQYSVRGYCGIGLRKNGVRKSAIVHRLVGEAFIPNPDNKPEIDHIDGNKNNNRVENLHWVTRKENQNSPVLKASMSKAKKGEKCYFFGKRNLDVHNARPVAQYNIQDNLIKIYPSVKEAYRETGINNHNIANVASGGTTRNGNRIYPAKTAGGFKWKYITREEYAEYAKNV